ncbi:PaaX family transcriptional regulator [Paenibacillus sp. P96]|uniref:PaaX family transcriptional regulator n=1 Tax=Paenibacillus zeirhizosphaerae TaxID=2987519 RepID=A0ABT9FLJ4_9BACL|nr:PaaX family transcriptional regulator C-terminal domain-containing protein [Paenibacillus sp. P96]MDP4095593.1 PaaX family transcriptional regulator [Paenibacillus sp. P96]
MLSVEKQMLFLMSRTEKMNIQDLLRIYEKRGYAPTYIRSSLSRLKKGGYVISPSRSMYRITDIGRSFVTSINGKPQRVREAWDGRWHIVMAGVPEEQRRKRDALRVGLLQFGFGMLYNGVYVNPWNNAQEVGSLVDSLELSGCVTCVSGSMEIGSITSQHAEKIWQLDKVAALYHDKWQWYKSEFEPLLRRADVQEDAALELFLLYLSIGESISDLFLLDPMLPAELLSPEWEEHHAKLEQMMETHRQLAGRIPDLKSVWPS